MNGRFLKKSQDRKIAGVCAGIAEYAGWTAIQIRILFIIFTGLGGGGLLAYILLAIFMPPADADPPSSFDLDDYRSN